MYFSAAVSAEQAGDLLKGSARLTLKEDEA
jgi:hypothetical protein